MFRFAYGPLMDAAGDGSAGGGTGAGLTEARVNELVSQGVKAGIEGFEKGAFKQFASSVPTADSIKSMLQEALKPAGGDGTPAGGGQGGDKGGDKGTPDAQTNAELKRLRADLDNANKRFGDSEKKAEDERKQRLATDKESKIRSSIQGYDFINNEALEDAYRVLDGAVTRDDQGNLVANNLPLEDFVKDFIPTKKGYLLKPVGTAGSGATQGTAKINGKPASMDDIRPGMSVEDSKAVGAAIKNAAAEAFGRK